MKLIISLVVVFALLASFASAFGIGSTFLDSNTLKIEEGQTAFYRIELQNSDDIDVPILFRLSSEADVAIVAESQEIYMVPANEVVKIVVNITSPVDARPGDKFKVTYSAQPQQVSGAGTLQFAPGITKDFTVLILEKEDTQNFEDFLPGKGFLYILLIAIIVAYGGYKQYERKRKK